MDFIELYNSHCQSVRRTVSRILKHSQGDVDDVCQETWIKVLDSLDSFRGDSSVYTWVTAIAANTAKRRYRNNKVEQTIVLPELVDEDGATLEVEGAADLSGPEEMLLAEQTARDIQEALDSLGEDFLEVLDMRDNQQLSYKEISDKIGMPVGTVKSRLSRARAVVNRHLASS